MTPLEFKEARKRLKKTQQDIAIQFCLSIRTIKRYESGETSIPYSVEMLFGEEGIEDNRIVGNRGYYVAEEIVNSFDKCFFVEAEFDNGIRHIYLLGCEYGSDRHTCVTEYIKGDSIDSAGRYLEAGSWFDVEGEEIDLQKTVTAFIRNYGANIIDITCRGLGFTEQLDIKNDPDSKDQKTNLQ
jgi:transcriptional regulator with XRE-family HTH domain